ncbi:hypothetical protein AMTR_s00074p00193640 [Amborella trichopoda]|uniref:Aminotransferase-like plant mobile domain-containing protein n=1 Tax=Amborella trichopoda TaxID=13333 RepID=W1NMA1_AMBTC|nr:hypothetical protein AMTR_s00074p00193640 [Amborella trichopoda]
MEGAPRQIDHDLTEAVTERWRPETNSLHCPRRVGEMMPTLYDVWCIFRLRVTGELSLVFEHFKTLQPEGGSRRVEAGIPSAERWVHPGTWDNLVGNVLEPISRSERLVLRRSIKGF